MQNIICLICLFPQKLDLTVRSWHLEEVMLVPSLTNLVWADVGICFRRITLYSPLQAQMLISTLAVGRNKVALLPGVIEKVSG